MITVNPDRLLALVDAFTILWEKSVRATHHFLSEEDIQKLIPFVKTGISEVGTLVIACNGDEPIAFMGIDADKIEMLFVLPDYFGKGVGRELVTFAIHECNVTKVDVNEQNPGAIGFYHRLGFEISERTELDEQGNPFPVLKMRLKI